MAKKDNDHFFSDQSIPIIITINVTFLFISKFKGRFLLLCESCKTQMVNYGFKLFFRIKT